MWIVYLGFGTQIDMDTTPKLTLTNISLIVAFSFVAVFAQFEAGIYVIAPYNSHTYHSLVGISI